MSERMVTIRMVIATWLVERALRIMPKGTLGKLLLAEAHLRVVRGEISRLGLNK